MGILLIPILSFVPMLLYTLFLWWLDRYEKEPLPLLVVAFIWGAIPSIILALISQLLLDIPIIALGTSPLMYDLLGASLIAPLTEEGIKALAVLALLLFMRQEIDSPIDGLVYGGIIGFGFAAVENVLYLASAYVEGGAAGVLVLGLLRSVVFGLNHAMFTGFTGLSVALSLEVKNKALRPLVILGGFLAAVGAHAFHNAFSTFSGYTDGGATSLLVALVADWSGVLLLLMVALLTFMLERQRILAYADVLVKSNAISEREITVLKSAWLRGMARVDALTTGGIQRWWTTGQYYQRLTESAFTWHRMNQGDPKSKERLHKLEQETRALRQALAAPPKPTPPQS